MPFKVADEALTFEAVPVTTVGTGSLDVVKVLSSPSLIPPLFEATNRKWYFVLGDSSGTVALTDTLLVPEPASLVDVLVP